MPGKDVTLELHFAEGKSERLAAIVQDVVRSKPDVIVAMLNPILDRSAEQPGRAGGVVQLSGWLDSFLRHPLVVAFVTLIAGTVVAYFLGEQWQRWRQRREFQYRALVKFSEASNRTHSVLWPFIARKLRGETGDDEFRAFRDEFGSLWMQLLAAHDEVAVAFPGLALPRECNSYLGTIEVLAKVSTDNRSCTTDELETLKISLVSHRQLLLD